MDFVDRNLKCQDCGNEFVFTAGEQLFFHDKQFKNDPKRCKDCKGKRSPARRTGMAAAAAARPRRAPMLAVRRGDDRSLPPHAGPPRALPPLLPETRSRDAARCARAGLTSRSPDDAMPNN